MTQTAYVLISAKYGQERAISQDLMHHDEVEDINILYGQYDILVKLAAKDMKSINDFILTHIRSHPHIEQTQSLIVVN